MYKLIAVTNTATADGFRLGGIDVSAVTSVEEAREVLMQLMDDEEVGVIALDDRYEEAIDERLRRKIDVVYRPIVVVIPLRDELDVKKLSDDRLARMIRRAVGFDVTLKKG